MNNNNIKVCIKIRPLIQREKIENLPPQWSLIDNNTLKSNNKEYKLSFDHIFDETRTTEELFNDVAKPIVESAVNGINGTIFAYGQTSSGKTYCMMGTDEEPGIIPLCVNEIFKQIEMNKDREYLIRIGYIEIYNEKIFDLLVENKQEICKIHETNNGEIAINQTEILSSNPDIILETYDKGSKGRKVGETCMNDRSSRSHTIFRIVIESHELGNDGVFQVSTLNLVDLAGSERVDQTKATGERLREGGHINKSLLSLSKVIRELGDLNDDKGKNVDGIKYINYRDSKLTRILSASLGGNAMTAIICTITPVALEETYSTLTFACNAKKIKNQPKVNETVSDKVIMNRLQKEIAALKDELQEEKSKNSEVSKIEKLIAQIFDRERQIIHSHSVTVAKTVSMNRRRTWCPMSAMEKIDEEVQQPFERYKLQDPPPFILTKNTPNFECSNTPDFLSNEEFQSPDKVKFGDHLSPDDDRNCIPIRKYYPKSLKRITDVDSPKVGKPKSVDEENEVLRLRIEYLENELEELQDFKSLEDMYKTPNNEAKSQLEDELRKQLAQSAEKVEMLEMDMTEKMIEIESLRGLLVTRETIEVDYKKALEDREKAENLLESVQYEYEQAKSKFKTRETELIQSLIEARNDSDQVENVHKEKIKKLEEMLFKTEQDLFAMEARKNDKDVVNFKHPQVLDMENVIKDLKNKLETAQKEKESAEQMLKEKNHEIETLSDQLVSAVEDTDDFQSKIDKLEATVKEKDCRLDELTAKIVELEDLSKRYQKIQEIVTVDEMTTEECFFDENDEVHRFIVKLKQTAVKTESLETENKQLMIQISENNRTNEEVEQLHTKIKEMEEKIYELEEKIKSQSDENENLSVQRENLSSQYEIATSRLEKLQKMIVDNDLDVENDDDVTQKIVKLQQDSNKLEAYEAEKLMLLQRIESDGEMEENVEELNYFSELHKLITKLKQRTSKVETLESENQTECPTINENLDESHLKIKELEENVKISSDENEALSSQHEKLSSQFENLSSEFERVSGRLEKIQKMLLNSEVEPDNDENDDITNRIIKLHQGSCKLEAIEAEKMLLMSRIGTEEEDGENNEGLTHFIDLHNLITQLKQKAIKVDCLESEIQQLNDQIAANAAVILEHQRIQEILTSDQYNVTDHDGQTTVITTIIKLRENAERTESLELEKHQLLNEIAEIRHDAEILTEKLSVNQTLSEAEFQLREKIDTLEVELKATKELNDAHVMKITEFEGLNLDLQIKNEEISKEKEEFLSQVEQMKALVELKMREFENLQEQLDENLLKTQAYESEISQLTSNLDLLKDQNLKLTDLNQELASKLVKLDAEHTNIKSQLVIKDEDLQALQKEIEVIKEQLRIKCEEYNEIKTRYRRRSEDNEGKLQELEKANSKLLQEVGAAQALKCSIESDLRKAKDECRHLLDENHSLKAENKSLKDKSNDNDMKYAILDEKFSQLSSINVDLETKLKDKINSEVKTNDSVKKYQKEIQELNEKITQQMTENDVKNKIVVDLTEKYEKLIQDAHIRKSSSPQHRRSDEKQLFTAQERHNQMQIETSTPVRTLKSNIDRRSRRQSAYEMNRDLSSWELTQDESTQTDAVDSLCACGELSEKIKQLQIEIRIRDSKIANHQRMANVNIYKYELEDAKTECQREKRENSKLKEAVENLKTKLKSVQTKNQDLELNQRCHNVQSTSVQTNSFNVIPLSEYEKIADEKNLLEKKLEEMKKQMNRLEMLSEKENMNSNMSSKLQANSSTESGMSDMVNNKLDYESLQNEYCKLQKKYDTAKRLCNLRHDDLTKIREELQVMTTTATRMSAKYETAKKILEVRMEKIRDLREKLGQKEEMKSDNFGDSVTLTNSGKKM